MIRVYVAAGLAALFAVSYVPFERIVTHHANEEVEKRAAILARAAGVEAQVSWGRLVEEQDGRLRASLAALSGLSLERPEDQTQMSSQLTLLVDQLGDASLAAVVGADGKPVVSAGNADLIDLSKVRALEDALGRASAVRASATDSGLFISAASPLGETTAAGVLVFVRAIEDPDLRRWSRQAGLDAKLLLLGADGKILASSMTPDERPAQIAEGAVQSIGGTAFVVERRDLVDQGGVAASVAALSPLDTTGPRAVIQGLRIVFFGLLIGAIAVVLIVFPLANKVIEKREAADRRYADEALIRARIGRAAAKPSVPVSGPPPPRESEPASPYGSVPPPDPFASELPRVSETYVPTSPRVPSQPYTPSAQPASDPAPSFRPDPFAPSSRGNAPAPSAFGGTSKPPEAKAPSTPPAWAGSAQDEAAARTAAQRAKSSGPYSASHIFTPSSDPPPPGSPEQQQSEPPAADSGRYDPFAPRRRMSGPPAPAPSYTSAPPKAASFPAAPAGGSAPPPAWSRTKKEFTRPMAGPVELPVSAREKAALVPKEKRIAGGELPSTFSTPQPLPAPQQPFATANQLDDEDEISSLLPSPDVLDELLPFSDPSSRVTEAEEATAARDQPAPRPSVPPTVQPFDEEHYREIYDDFIEKKEMMGEPLDGVTFDAFRDKLRTSEERLMKAHGCRAVRFQVTLRDDRVSLRPLLVR